MSSLFKKIVRKLFSNDKAAIASLSENDQSLIHDIRNKKLTYLSGTKLASIVETCRGIEERNLGGMFIEAGCALGGSTILISKLKSADRLFNVYDVFDMIPPPGSNDGDDVKKRYNTIRQGTSGGIGGDKYYGYEDNLLAKVRENLASFELTEREHSVHLIKGLLQDTMKLEKTVAFAHIDVDWYDPVMTCLERITPRLVVGGSIILDDYQDWSGCRKATDKFFDGKSAEFQMDVSAGSMKVTRILESPVT